MTVSRHKAPPRRPQDTPPNPEAVPQPEDAQPATPLETAAAKAQAFEALVGKLEQELNGARIKMLKWQGAAEYMATLDFGRGPPNGKGNGQDTADPLTPNGDKEPNP